MSRQSCDVQFRSFGGLLSIFVILLSLLYSTSHAFLTPTSPSTTTSPLIPIEQRLTSTFELYAKKKKKKKRVDDGSKTICINRAARRNYEVLETIEAGVSLKGTEVKSIRDGKMNIKDGWIKPNKNGRSCELMNVHISKHSFTGMHDQHEETRPRPLLLHREQARKFAQQVEQNNGMT